jgi:predicted TIM-barrel fold metal-dependent hydrolase
MPGKTAVEEHFSRPSLRRYRPQWGPSAAIVQIGADRIVCATDYPVEKMAGGTAGFDRAPIGEADRVKIAGTNAEALSTLHLFVVRAVK